MKLYCGMDAHIQMLRPVNYMQDAVTEAASVHFTRVPRSRPTPTPSHVIRRLHTTRGIKGQWFMAPSPATTARYLRARASQNESLNIDYSAELTDLRRQVDGVINMGTSFWGGFRKLKAFFSARDVFPAAINAPDGTRVSEPLLVIQTALTYFENLYTDAGDRGVMSFDESFRRALEERVERLSRQAILQRDSQPLVVHLGSVVKAIRKLTTRTAPGIDGILPEFLFWGTMEHDAEDEAVIGNTPTRPTFPQAVGDLFRSMLLTSAYPRPWTLGNMMLRRKTPAAMSFDKI